MAKKKHRRKTPKPVIQIHHITYTPERTVTIWKGEHWILTRMQWRKRVSKGFIEAIEQIIIENKEKAFDLKSKSSE